MGMPGWMGQGRWRGWALLPSAQGQGAHPQGNWALCSNQVAYMLGVRLASMAYWRRMASEIWERVGGLRVRLGRRPLVLRLRGCDADGDEGEGTGGSGRLHGDAGEPKSCVLYGVEGNSSSLASVE